MKFLRKFGFQPQVSVSAVTTTPERLAEMSQQAKARMKGWGLKTVLEGAEVDLMRNHVLVAANRNY